METVEKQAKTYLYHMVPKDMEGGTLHPLNRLKEAHPHLFESKAGKYTGREGVMEKFIPTLECKWNDVLQFSPIHPAELKHALIEAGMEPREMKFFQIDPELLDPEKTTVYLYSNLEESEMDTDFVKYDSATVASHSILKDATKAYWQAKFRDGDKPLLFVGIPHVLHKGSIDISDLPVITV